MWRAENISKESANHSPQPFDINFFEDRYEDLVLYYLIIMLNDVSI